jgi:hypothetical protein
MKKLVPPYQVTPAQIYRSVASSTAIETGKPVQEIERQLKRNRTLAKNVGLANKSRDPIKPLSLPKQVNDIVFLLLLVVIHPRLPDLEPYAFQLGNRNDRSV